MTTTRSITLASALTSYLLRGLWRRVDWDSIGRDRRRGIVEELGNALYPIAISERSTLGWVRAVCTRFAINASGGGFLGTDGEERTSRPAYAFVPRVFLPADVTTMPHDAATPEKPCVRWDVLVKCIDFESLRLALHENPASIATFATADPVDGEESLFPLAEEVRSVAPWTPTLPRQIHSPRAHWTVWTLTSNMAHGADDKSGNTTMFRRDRLVDPVTGRQYLRPFISGNAVRGMWRDGMFGLLLRRLGLRAESLPPATAHALLSGGSIEAGADGGTVNVSARRKAREMCPPWDLLAGCVSQQIMKGLLRVNDAILVCRENAWMLHHRLAPMRHDERAPYDEFAASLPSADDLTQLRLATRHAHRDLEGSSGAQMIFNTELLLPGAQMVHSFSLAGIGGVSELAGSCMADFLAEFQAEAFVGAGNSRGYGQVAFDQYLPGEESYRLPSPAVYRRWLDDNADAVRDWLMGAGADAAEEKPKKAARSAKKKADDAPAAEAA